MRKCKNKEGGTKGRSSKIGNSKEKEKMQIS